MKARTLKKIFGLYLVALLSMIFFASRGEATKSAIEAQLSAGFTGITGALTPAQTWSKTATAIHNGVIVGATGTTAGTGEIGEHVRSFLAFGSRNALVHATPETVTSIDLTAGDWDVSAICGFGGAALTGNTLYASISPTNNTLATDYGDNIWDTSLMPTAAASSYIVIPSYRVSLTSSATYYLVAQANFSGGSTGAFGRISARRVR